MYTSSRIDWLSFTIPCLPMQVRSHDEMYSRVGEAQRNFAPTFNWDILSSSDWEAGKGRAPYKECLRSPYLGVSVYWGVGLEHILFEFSGVGCERLRQKLALDNLLTVTATRVTRLDVATDFITDTTPAQFVECGYSDRIASRGSFASQTGLTEYIGSAKSERFARVYRYAPPHPRSDCLRVEHVLRRDYARTLVPFIVQHGVMAAARTIGDQFGWQHSLWTELKTDGFEWHAPRNDRKSSGTERWLITQAASAFRKLVVSGVIENPYEWVAKHFLEGIADVYQLPLQLETSDDSSEGV